MSNPEDIKQFMQALKEHMSESKGWIGMVLSVREGNEIRATAISQGNGPVSLGDKLALTLALYENSAQLVKKLWSEIQFEGDRHAEAD